MVTVKYLVFVVKNFAPILQCLGLFIISPALSNGKPNVILIGSISILIIDSVNIYTSMEEWKLLNIELATKTSSLLFNVNLCDKVSFTSHLMRFVY